MKLSVIIPVYNEEKTIPRLLPSLAQLYGRAEIIFADGGSADRTRDLIPPGCALIDAPKGRARQMNAGARAASGDVLFFLHCDSVLPDGAYDEIEKVMASHRAGCFGIAFDSCDLRMTVCRILSNLRARRGIIFGDQGLFIDRGLFEELGGFPDLPLMEDYQFSLTMRERGVSTGMAGKRITTSARRFLSGGPLRTMRHMRRLRAMYRRGVDIDEIARLYRDVR